MSHVTTCKMKVRDLDALETACDALGLELQRGQTRFAWWGRFEGDSTPPPGRDPKDYGKCEHAIKIKGDRPVTGHNGPWEIGVVPALDGDGYELMFDEYGTAGRRLAERVGGKDPLKLKQQYSAALTERKTVDKLSRHGWRAERETLPGGYLRIALRKR